MDNFGFYVAYFIHLWRSKQNRQKIPNFDVKLKGNQNWLFFGNFILITMGEPNMPQKIQIYLEIAENVVFFHIVVAFL